MAELRARIGKRNVGPESGRLILENTDGHVQSGKSLEAAENSGHFIVFTYMPFFFPHFCKYGDPNMCQMFGFVYLFVFLCFPRQRFSV